MNIDDGRPQRCVGTKDRPACPNWNLSGYRRCYYCEKSELLAGFQLWIILGPLLGVVGLGLILILLDRFGGGVA